MHPHRLVGKKAEHKGPLPFNFNPNCKDGVSSMPVMDNHLLTVSKSYVPMMQLSDEKLASLLFGTKLLPKFEMYNLQSRLDSLLRKTKDFERTVKRGCNGLPKPRTLDESVDFTLEKKSLRSIIIHIFTNLLHPFLRPKDLRYYAEELARALLTTGRRKEIKRKSSKCLIEFSDMTKHFDVPPGDDRDDFLSAVCINTGFFTTMIVLYYLQAYFTISYNIRSCTWDFVRTTNWRNEGRSEWKNWRVDVEQAEGAIESSNPKVTTSSAPAEPATSFKISIESLSNAYKSSSFRLVGMESISLIQFSEKRRDRVPLIVGEHVFDKYPRLGVYETLDFYVKQLIRFSRRFDGLISQFQTQSSMRTAVDFSTLLSYVHTFLQHSPQKWLYPSQKSSENKITKVLCERLTEWKPRSEEFFCAKLAKLAKHFDFFHKNHANDFPLEARERIINSTAYHTFRLFCLLLLQNIHKTFEVEETETGLNLYMVNPNNCTHSVTGTALSSVNTSGNHKRRLPLESSGESEVRDVQGTPPVKKEKVCITIEESPPSTPVHAVDKKPNLAELKLLVQLPQPETPKEHTFDLKRVKAEKTEKAVEASPKSNVDKAEVLEKGIDDILMDKIDFMKFKTDIDADQNILSIYKTIFGLALESREDFRTRCIALMRENAVLRDQVRALEG